jgi:cytochrome c biogenesis protein CcdA
MLATLVDTSALAKVVAVSLIATIGLTTAFAAAILGAARFADMRRDERLVEAALFGALVVVGLAVCVAGVALGIVVMTTK